MTPRQPGELISAAAHQAELVAGQRVGVAAEGGAHVGGQPGTGGCRTVR